MLVTSFRALFRLSGQRRAAVGRTPKPEFSTTGGQRGAVDCRRPMLAARASRAPTDLSSDDCPNGVL